MRYWMALVTLGIIFLFAEYVFRMTR